VTEAFVDEHRPKGGMECSSKQKRKSRILLCPPVMELPSVALVCYRMCYCDVKINTLLLISFCGWQFGVLGLSFAAFLGKKDEC
jgi:hypothetical protein